jgi:hypothetical protein
MQGEGGENHKGTKSTKIEHPSRAGLHKNPIRVSLFITVFRHIN